MLPLRLLVFLELLIVPFAVLFAVTVFYWYQCTGVGEILGNHAHQAKCIMDTELYPSPDKKVIIQCKLLAA